MSDRGLLVRWHRRKRPGDRYRLEPSDMYVDEVGIGAAFALRFTRHTALCTMFILVANGIRKGLFFQVQASDSIGFRKQFHSHLNLDRLVA